MQELVNANIDALEQVLTLIKSAPASVYNLAPESVTYGTGRHVRHILDHYTALQLGLASGEIDYDNRCRDSATETDPRAAEREILALINWLKEAITCDKPLNMKTEISIHTQQHVMINSSLQRELTYLLNHTLHHCAYASLILRLLGVTTDERIGVAPATSTYFRNNNLNLN